MTMLRGIDVSRNQGTVDWRRARDAGARFAWIKATEGADWIDPQLNANASNALGAASSPARTTTGGSSGPPQTRSPTSARHLGPRLDPAAGRGLRGDRQRAHSEHGGGRADSRPTRPPLRAGEGRPSRSR